MSLEIFDAEQGSEAWLKLRCGLPTASEFATVLARGKDGGASITRAKYLRRLAGEVITGEPEETYSNGYMARGNAMEAEARNFYAFFYDEVELRQVGFIRNGRKGCSPDSLVGSDGLLEVKTALPSILIEKIVKNDFPPEHMAQCQGALWVAEREFIDITVFWPRMPTFVKRATRNEIYIAKLAAEVARFNDELDELVEKIRRYGGMQEIAA